MIILIAELPQEYTKGTKDQIKMSKPITNSDVLKSQKFLESMLKIRAISVTDG